MDANEASFLAWVADQFYCQNVSQQVLAEKLRSSKATVCRLIQKAVKEKIVTFQITVPLENDATLEHELEKLFSLKRAVIMKDENEMPAEKNYADRIGKFGASFLCSFIKEGDLVGVSGGRNVNSLIKYLKKDNCTQKIESIQLSGVYSQDIPELTAFYAAQQLAAKFSSKLNSLLLPAITSSHMTRELLMKEPAFQEYFEMMKRVDVAVMGIGSLIDEVPDSYLYRTKYLTDKELKILRTQDAVGVLLSHVLNRQGDVLKTSFANRAICLDADYLKKIPNCILISGGRNKVIPIYAALSGHYINILVSDSRTARALLELKRQQ